ncbi:MAG: hypothetical protein IPO04_06285 [Cytophagaceae bacterium]|nr:hypothetical protein [Cytophagaceae bacterium]
MKKIILFVAFFSMASLLFAQEGKNVGIGTLTPSKSAALDIQAIDKGLLIPRMSSQQRDAIQKSS